MNKSRRHVCLALSVAPLAIPAAWVEAQGVPNDVAGAERALATWLKGLNGLSPTQAEKSLGAPRERATWDFMGSKPPLLRYKTPGGGKLELYFAENRVINASFQLMSS